MCLDIVPQIILGVGAEGGWNPIGLLAPCWFWASNLFPTPMPWAGPCQLTSLVPPYFKFQEATELKVTVHLHTGDPHCATCTNWLTPAESDY